MQRPSIRLAGLLLSVAACPAAAAAPPPAPPLHYLLDLPANRTLSYEIEFEVVRPGRLRIEAHWAPSRVLAFRVERPGMPAFRRSGPPPLEFELPVASEDVRRDEPWTLTIGGLRDREASRGELFIHLPAGVEEPAPTPPALPRRSDPPPSLDPWMMPATAPSDLDGTRRRLFESAERFRLAVVADEGADADGWRSALLKFVTAYRDESLKQESVLQRPTRRLFQRIGETVRKIERLSLQPSQPLGEPPPQGGLRRRAWDSVRDPRFVPVEAELDAMLIELQRGHLPELDAEPSFSSFLSIVIACERHFEERARLGPEHAGNETVVRNEWAAVLVAAAALEALSALP